MAESADWKLSFCAALGVGFYITLLICISSGVVVKHTLHEAPAKYMATGVLRLVITLTSSVGLACYALVASGAPRPRLLHTYGLVLAVGAVQNVGVGVGEVIESEGVEAGDWLTFAFFHVVWGAYRTLFYRVLTDKLRVLGPPASRYQDIRLWGRALVVFTILISVGGSCSWLTGAFMVLRGVSREDVLKETSTFPFTALGLDAPLLDRIAMSVFIQFTTTGGTGFFVAALAYMYISWHLVHTVEVNLATRGVEYGSLSKVHSMLRRHRRGLLLTLSSTVAHIIATFIDGLNLLRQEDAEDLLLAAVTLVDTGGDVLGILLLSGIGTILFGGEPDAADINRYIRSSLHAAVLTGRADFAFEGRVVSTASKRCIASFPGKYQPEWKSMTWLCQRQEMSTACVFLPTSDPMNRFGKHTPCVETPNHCWCTPLYGEVKPWGCLWFQTWKENVERAVELGLDLVVVFFQGEVGQGIVEWGSLPSTDLWDGRGLGGSQKGEVAFLLKQGINFRSVDLDTARPWLRGA